jgi:hypothetical protein
VKQAVSLSVVEVCIDRENCVIRFLKSESNKKYLASPKDLETSWHVTTARLQPGDPLTVLECVASKILLLPCKYGCYIFCNI